jgi:hypothetical protein
VIPSMVRRTMPPPPPMVPKPPPQDQVTFTAWCPECEDMCEWTSTRASRKTDLGCAADAPNYDRCPKGDNR